MEFQIINDGKNLGRTMSMMFLSVTGLSSKCVRRYLGSHVANTKL